MAAKIGIKLADGTFFPIMNDEFSASETLELTTVRNNQRSVQINLFKRDSEESAPAYIGSLIVEDIRARTAGDPTIELHLSLDEHKNLSAEALDKDSGSHQVLHVALENLSDQSFESLDFDLAAEISETDIDLTTSRMIHTETLDRQHAFSATSGNTDDESEKKRSFPLWLLMLLILLGLAALVLGVLLLTKKSLSDDDKPIAIQPEPAVVVPSEPIKEKSAPALPAESRSAEPPTPAVEQSSESQRDESAAQTSATSIEATAEQKGQAQEMLNNRDSTTAASMGKAVKYKLRWGDTLWDLSETYYRNPWLYTKIAKHNKIKNPDLVISGTYIEIPPQ